MEPESAEPTWEELSAEILSGPADRGRRQNGRADTQPFLLLASRGWAGQ
jgi:hypothetical protein